MSSSWSCRAKTPCAAGANLLARQTRRRLARRHLRAFGHSMARITNETRHTEATRPSQPHASLRSCSTESAASTRGSGATTVHTLLHAELRARKRADQRSKPVIIGEVTTLTYLLLPLSGTVSLSRAENECLSISPHRIYREPSRARGHSLGRMFCVVCLSLPLEAIRTLKLSNFVGGTAEWGRRI